MQNTHFIDRKNLSKPHLPAIITHELQLWSEDEVSIKRRTTQPTSIQVTNKSPSQQVSGAKTKRATEKFRDKLNIRYKDIQTSLDKNIKKTFRERSEKNNPNSYQDRGH